MGCHFLLQGNLPDSGGAVVKNLPANADVAWTPGLGRSPGIGNGSPLQSSCLDNSLNRKTGGQVIIHGIPKSCTRLSDRVHTQARTCVHFLPKSLWHKKNVAYSWFKYPSLTLFDSIYGPISSCLCSLLAHYL